MKRKALNRALKGMSIVEMLVVLAVTGVAIAGLTEISWLSFDWINKFSTKVDVNIAAKRALERVGNDLRIATCIGDSFEPPSDTTPTFPSSNNPLYSAGMPAGASTTYQIDDNTLIFQVPVFNNKGWPTSLPTSVDSNRRKNVDTIIYEVVQDPEQDASGQIRYLLKRTFFAGVHDSTQIPNVNPGQTLCPAQTILTGIVGPLDKNTGKPQIFQALDQLNPGGNPIPLSLLRTYSLPRINGIVMNIEIQRSQSASKNTSTASFRSEIMIRNRHYVE
ncbi:MAG: hypothetical protein DKT66_18030 [Candidatus Melainabacteria bacterium]|nr:MAG: hypothetical protein DKT66_18030 [Candidatus Melainabacteria bacterium]